MDKSTWKDVAGFEGLYRVSEEGDVFSVPRRTPRLTGKGSREIPGRGLKPVVKTNGYLQVNLYDQESKVHQKAVHRIVAEAHLPNPDNLPWVLHWNDIKNDNRVSNLRWGTSEHNAADRLRNGRSYHASKTHCENGHEFSEENTLYPVAPPGTVHRRCRICRRAAARKSKENRKGGSPSNHGTSYAYREYKCRCNLCVEAHDNYLKTLRTPQREKITCEECGKKVSKSNISRHRKQH